ncbi:uncharacterized protein LOC119066004 [Bradysia coprophila]|uniref:uncharacterized protein LOC119066004 n=1 Tax=Bradysia coprophila TaxID=38358 RepID=UPI00187D7C01|nr:uncharacterized protein LOC119066004 [Bradysia coprophila]
MVVPCVVRGCETVGTSGLHRFPKDKSAAEKWIFAIKALHLVDRLNSNKLSGSFYKVCRKHFAQSDLIVNGKGQVIVKQGSTPSLFLPADFDIPSDVHHIQRSPSKPANPVKQGSTPSLFRPADIDIPSDVHHIQRSSSKPANPVKRLQHHRSKKSTEPLDKNEVEIGVESGCIPKSTKLMNDSRRSNQLSYYKRRTKDLQAKVKETKLSDKNVLSYLKSKFNENLFEFFKMQLKNCGRSNHGRRYTDRQKSLCLAMYKKGPKSYRFNATWSCLPTKRTLGRYSAGLIFQSEVDTKALAAIKNIIADWPRKDKFCTFGR